jgi:hypothetical protein
MSKKQHTYEELIDIKKKAEKLYTMKMRLRAIAQEHIDDADAAEADWIYLRDYLKDSCSHTLDDGSSAITESDFITRCSICDVPFPKR